jgi:O-succinylbenzoate synthase
MTVDLTPVGSIELREVALPLVEQFETSYGVENSKRALLVILRKGKIVAFGECVAGTGPAYGEETAVSARQIIKNQLASVLLKERLKTPAEFLEATERVRGYNMAVAAVEMALWDLQGKIENKPISRLLGGVGSEVDACATAGIQPTPKQLVKKVGGYVRQGYRIVKLKITPGRDVEYVEAVRAKFPSIGLRVDANGAYRLEALPTLKKLDNFGLSLIEQPLVQGDLTGHSKLQRELSTPICLDESIRSPNDAKNAIEVGACRIINVKPGKVRGLGRSREIHDICVDCKIPALCGGMLETGIGRSFNVALATLPGFTLPGDLSASNRYFKKDLIENEFELTADGKLTVPPGAGCGIMVDEAYLDAVTTSSELLAGTWALRT